MFNKRINNILKKEWRVLSRDINSMLMITLLPLLIIGQALLIIWLIDRFGSETLLTNGILLTAIDNLREALPAVTNLKNHEQLQVLLLSQMNVYLLLIPTMIAINLATFSIVDEKLSGSLEALLATPVRTWELLLGKALTGALPALLITWICSLIFILSVVGIGWGQLVSLIVTPSLFLYIFVLTPAVAMLSFLLGVIGSSRAKDARSAQNGVLFIIFPLLAIIGLQVTGLIWLKSLTILGIALGIAVIDIVVLRAAVRLFQRESIVLKWR